jgi:putative transposase
MFKNHKLAKARPEGTRDAGWSHFVTLTTYKTLWAGGGVLKADRFFPSSKLCCNCGEKNHRLTLNVRQWVCLNCGVIHDRDENAAINILNQATVGATESHAMGDTRVQASGCPLGAALEAQQL